MGTDAATGDLRRDIADRLRVMVWRPQSCTVRAIPDSGERMLRFVLCTPGVKRDGHSVATEPEAWELGHFRARPVMLWSHSYGDLEHPPLPQIGEWPNVEFERAGDGWRMIGDARFASWDLPEVLYRMYLPREHGGDGLRGGTSIGWSPLEATPNESGGLHMTRNELHEVSLVNVGADPQALQRAIQSGRIPERLVAHLAANRLTEAARGRGAYLLDGRDVIEVRGEASPEAEPIEAQQDAQPTPPARAVRSERSDRVDLLCAQMAAIHLGMAEPLAQVRLLPDNVFAVDEDRPRLEGGYETPTRALGVLVGMLTTMLDLAGELQAALEPVGADASVVQAVTRVGKKISGARLDKLRAAHADLRSATTAIGDVIADGDGEQKEAAALPPPFARIAADIEQRVSDAAQGAQRPPSRFVILAEALKR